MGDYHCYKVTAYVELNVEEIVDAILREYSDIAIEDVNMDNIYEYVDDHITYMDKRNGGRGIKEVADGPSVEGFDQYDYQEIEIELEQIKRERTKPDIVQYSFDLRDPIDEQGLIKILKDAGVDVVGSSFTQRWTDKEYWRK